MDEFWSWPRRVNGVLVEPLNGFVRVRGEGVPVELSVADVRLLAGCAHTTAPAVLERVAGEASRRAASLAEVVL